MWVDNNIWDDLGFWSDTEVLADIAEETVNTAPTAFPSTDTPPVHGTSKFVSPQRNPAHDDMQGLISTGPPGNSDYTVRQYRTTGLYLPHVADANYWTQTIQFTHRKMLDTDLDSYHIHYIPVASANGTIVFDYAWGWFNDEATIPATLPNTGSVTLTLATTDQYKNKIFTIVSGMDFPTGEDYSSFFIIKVTRNGGTWGNTNEIAIWSADVHFLTDRPGSINEFSDE